MMTTPAHTRTEHYTTEELARVEHDLKTLKAQLDDVQMSALQDHTVRQIKSAVSMCVLVCIKVLTSYVYVCVYMCARVCV